MAKSELFRGPLGRLFTRLGAFPVRRGESDADAIATATALLDEGHVLVIFPEGTRVEERDVLGSPHHGAGRLALETGIVQPRNVRRRQARGGRRAQPDARKRAWSSAIRRLLRMP